MTISEQLMNDMKASMLAGEAARTGVLRLLRAALKNDAIKLGHELSEAEALKVLTREAKQRRDSIDAYQTAGRQDLVDQEELELGIITGYLPKPLSEAELAAIVDEVVDGLGATDMKAMGQVIGAVMGRVGASADGGAVSALVKARLSR